MRYSTRTRYGLRFLINLATRKPGTYVQLAEIAKEESISMKYLEQIVRVLRPAGIVQSLRGARGGYALASPPTKITMDVLFQILEGYSSPVICLSPHSVCPREKNCPTRRFWQDLDAYTQHFLAQVTLASFIKTPSKGFSVQEENLENILKR